MSAAMPVDMPAAGSAAVRRPGTRPRPAAPAFLAALALLAALLLPPAAPAAGARLEFLPLGEALEKSRSEGKFTMLFFWTASCPVCRLFGDEVLAAPEVVEDLNRDFVVVSIDSGRERALSRRYRVNSVPRLVFLDPAGTPATVLPGALQAPLFRLFLGYVASNSFRTMEFDEFVESLM